MSIDTRLFDRDDFNGLTRLFHFDNDTEQATIETITDVEPLLEQNKLFQRCEDSDKPWGDMKRVAQIPMSLYFTLKEQGIVDDPKRMKKWLNDRDNQLFRTRPGVV